MSIGIQDVGSLNAIFKEQYVDKLKDLRNQNPEQILLSDIPFDGANKTGDIYSIAVALSRSHGKTYLGTSADPRNLNSPKGGVTKKASVTPAALMFEEALTITAASRSGNTQQAFVDASKYVVKSLIESHRHTQEAIHWYGQSGHGTFTAATADLNANKITIDDAEFATALWRAAEGQTIDIYDSTGNTKVLTTDIAAVNLLDRTLTLSSVTGLVDSTAYIIYDNEAKGNESRGLQSILTATTDLFGINPTTYERWAPNIYTPGSTPKLDYGVWSTGAARAQSRGMGGKGQMLKNMVSHRQFRNLIPDLETLASGSSTATKGARRTSGADVQKLEHGVDRLVFNIGGLRAEFFSNAYVKNGLCFVIDTQTMKRIGSKEIGFDLPGTDKDEYLRRREGTNYLSIGSYSDQALFCDNPSRNLIINGLGV